MGEKEYSSEFYSPGYRIMDIGVRKDGSNAILKQNIRVLNFTGTIRHTIKYTVLQAKTISKV